MRLDASGVEIPQASLNAMQAGIDAMGIVDPKVIASPHFDQTVREITGFTAYTSERGAGLVAAKTVGTDDGPVIILNAPAVIGEGNPAGLERLLAHECGHAVLESRGEVLQGWRHLAPTEIEWKLLCLGGLAMEEFRIERRLFALGYPASDSTSVDHLDEALSVNNYDLISALVDPANGQDVEALEAAVIAIVDRFTKLLAYMAAPVIALDQAFDPSKLSAPSRDHWNDYVGRTWSQRLDLYRDIPDVSEPLDEDEWARILVAGLQLETAFLEKIGFYYTSNGDGYGFWRVQDDPMFERRLSRANREARTRND